MGRVRAHRGQAERLGGWANALNKQMSSSTEGAGFPAVWEECINRGGKLERTLRIGSEMEAPVKTYAVLK